MFLSLFCCVNYDLKSEALRCVQIKLNSKKASCLSVKLKKGTFKTSVKFLWVGAIECVC